MSAERFWLEVVAPHSWSVACVCEWRRHLTLGSAIRFRNYLARRGRRRVRDSGRLALDVRAPYKARVYLREVGSDVFTFQEIIKAEIYQPAVVRLPSCQTIIDLGANIGLASLYLASRYPTSRVFAVEPNPSSYELLELNLRPL